MDLDQCIALITSIGTCLAAVATFLTVRQIKIQRELTCHPEILIPLTFFGGTASKNTFPIYWKRKDVVKEEPEKPDTTLLHIPDFKVDLYNIGLGVAKDITVSWSFPIDDIVKDINDLAQCTMTAVYISFTNNNALSIKSASFTDCTIFWENEKEQKIDFILPTAINKNPSLLKLPLSYIHLVSMLIFLSIKDKEKKSFPEIPLLKATFQYTDIGEIKKTAAFNFHFNLMIAFEGCKTFEASLRPIRHITP